MTRYISQTETAKLVRKTLKEHFPKQKFSVTQHYNSIRVKWTDGPALTRVQPVVRFFEGSTFDAYVDLKSYVTTEFEGEEVQFGADYVFAERKTSRAFVEAILASYQRRWGRCDISIRGNDEWSWFVDDWEHRNDYRMLGELMDCTDAQDASRAYEAMNEREEARRVEWMAGEAERRRQQAAEDLARQQAQAEKERLEREAHRQKEAERQASEKTAREREGMRQAQRAILSSSFSARMYLGVPMNADERVIKAAFTRKVREAADGQGGYTTDMHFLVQVRDRALQG